MHTHSLIPRPRPAFCCLQYGKVGEGPGIFSHMSDVRIERMVERVWLCVGALGPEQWKSQGTRYIVAYHMYVTSGRWRYYTLSIKCVVGWKYAKYSLLVWQIFVILWLHHEKRYQASPTFLYCKQQKSGQGLGTRLAYTHVHCNTLTPQTKLQRHSSVRPLMN